MSDPNNNAGRSSNGTMFFIVGALVVAVGVLYWLFSAGPADVTTDTTAPAETNVTIDNSTAPAAVDAPAATEPAATEPAATTETEPAGN